MSDPLFIPTKAVLPYNGKSKVGYSDAGEAQQAKDDAEGGATSARQQAVLAALEVRRAAGVTIAELCEVKGWHHGQASGALSALNLTGHVVRLRNRRKGQSIYVLPEHIAMREVAARRENPRVVQAAEPEIRYVEREVTKPVELSPVDVEFLTSVIGRVERQKSQASILLKTGTVEHLLDIIEILRGTKNAG